MIVGGIAITISNVYILTCANHIILSGVSLALSCVHKLISADPPRWKNASYMGSYRVEAIGPPPPPPHRENVGLPLEIIVYFEINPKTIGPPVKLVV